MKDMMMHTVSLAAVLVIGMMVSPATPVAGAQTGQQGSPETFERVDQGFEDVGPMRTSARRLGVDLRLPSDFRSVYRVRRGEHEGEFARISGALSAVFPRSTYTVTNRGVFPSIPPGTVFRIGDPSEILSGAEERARRLLSPNFADYRASLVGSGGRGEVPMRAAGRASRAHVSGSGDRARRAVSEAVRTPARVTTPSIITSPGYRSTRVRSLLERAASSG